MNTRDDQRGGDGIATARVLNACDACGRQYDVSHLDAGRKVRCECGKTFLVRVQQPHSPRALKCSNCGGVLRDAARKCDYCAAEITLEERRLASICPKCFARMAVGAKFCMECGIEVQPQALLAFAEGTVCPRCKAPLASRMLGNVAVVECAHCGGFWMNQDAFVSACEQNDIGGEIERALGGRPPRQDPAQQAPVSYLKCIACGELMWRKNYGHSSGVIIDVCNKHGVWLDHRELQKILAFVRGGGLERARRLEIEQLKNEQERARNATASSAAGSAWLDIDPHRRRGNGFDSLIDLLGNFLR